MQEEDNEDERCQLAEEAARSEKMLQDDHRAFRNALLAAQLTINQVGWAECVVVVLEAAAALVLCCIFAFVVDGDVLS